MNFLRNLFKKDQPSEIKASSGRAQMKDEIRFWVARKDPNDMYIIALVTRMYIEDPARFTPKLAEAVKTGQFSYKLMWNEEEKRTYILIQPR